MAKKKKGERTFTTELELRRTSYGDYCLVARYPLYHFCWQSFQRRFPGLSRWFPKGQTTRRRVRVTIEVLPKEETK